MQICNSNKNKQREAAPHNHKKVEHFAHTGKTYAGTEQPLQENCGHLGLKMIPRIAADDFDERRPEMMDEFTAAE